MTRLFQFLVLAVFVLVIISADGKWRNEDMQRAYKQGNAFGHQIEIKLSGFSLDVTSDLVDRSIQIQNQICILQIRCD